MTTEATPGRGGFTLVELLAVLAIIAIVAGITVAAFNGLTRGTKMEAAASTLRGTLGMARQWAITHNQTTFVVFPDADDLSLFASPNQVHADKALRAYNVYTAQDGYVHTWTYLPDGVLFVSDTDGSLYPKATNMTVFSRSASVKWPDSDSSVTQNVPALAFRADGSLVSGSEIEIYLGEGAIDYDVMQGNVGTPVYRPPEESALLGLEVAPFTGSVRIRDYRDVP